MLPSIGFLTPQLHFIIIINICFYFPCFFEPPFFTNAFLMYYRLSKRENSSEILIVRENWRPFPFLHPHVSFQKKSPSQNRLCSSADLCHFSWKIPAYFCMRQLSENSFPLLVAIFCRIRASFCWARFWVLLRVVPSLVVCLRWTKCWYRIAIVKFLYWKTLLRNLYASIFKCSCVSCFCDKALSSVYDGSTFDCSKKIALC